MNTITYQLIPMANLLNEVPIQKDEFLKRAREKPFKKSLINLVEMIEFDEVYKKGSEIVLK